MRGLPLDFFDVSQMTTAAGKCKHLVVCMCSDRASANFAMLGTLWGALDAPGMPLNVYPFIEPCAAHGIALTKARPRDAKSDFVKVSHTLSTLMRQNRFATGLRDAIVSVLEEKLEIRYEPRPDENREKTKQIMGWLFGDERQDHLYVKGPNGQRKPGRLLQDVEELIDVLDVGLADPGSLVHWCSKGTARSSANTPCCVDRSEAISKIAVPFLNLFVHRGWETCAVSRWTYVMNMLRKIGMSIAFGGILLDALRHMMVFWQVDMSMVSTLERMVAADQNDFASRNRLRLLRVCKCFCAEGTPSRLAGLIVALSTADEVLYDILGHESREKVNLAKLLDESDSPLSRCQGAIFSLLSAWGAEEPGWVLFSALGGSYTDIEARSFCRRQLLQLSTAMVDYFTLRMAKPPYTLAKLLDSAVSHDRRLDVASDFYRVPDHCLSMFCRRLKLAFPTPDALLVNGRVVVQAMVDGAFVDVSHCERSHAAMRLDIRSTGRAKNYTCSANRMQCREVRTAMKDMTGRDPAMDISLVPLPSLAKGSRGQHGASADNTQPERKKGGNPYFCFLNHKRHCFKAQRAPDRALTEGERREVGERARAEWDKMDEEGREAWRTKYQTSLLPIAGDPASAPDSVVAKNNCRGLWDSSSEAHPACPFSEDMLVQYRKRNNYQQREKDAFDDPSLKVTAAERDATENPNTHRLLFGCFAGKKNVCRETLGDEIRQRVERLTTSLSKFVDHLGAAVVHAGEVLVRFHLPRADDEDGMPVDALGLILDARYRPKMQFIARCVLFDGPDDRVCRFPPTFPVDIRIASGTCRISPQHRAVDILTSDEWALELAAVGADWEIHQLMWEDPVDASLLRLRATGTHGKFAAQAKARPRRGFKFDLPAEVFEGNPIELGRLAAGTSSQQGMPSTDLPAPIGDLVGSPGEAPVDTAGGEDDVFGDDFAEHYHGTSHENESNPRTQCGR